MKENSKKSRLNSKFITWLLMLVSFIFVLISIFYLRALPLLWRVIGSSIFLILVLIMLVISIKRSKSNVGKIVICTFNVLMAMCLFIISITIFKIQTNLENIFTNGNGQMTLTYDVYAMSESYKQDHAKDFESQTTSLELSEYANKSFVVQSKLDVENQAIAINRLKETLNTDTLNIEQVDTVWDAVQSLYLGSYDALLINSGYVPMIEENPAYQSFNEDAIKIGTIDIQVKEEKVIEKTDVSKTFSIYIAGNDQEGSLSTYGRMDVNMIMTIDPVNNQIYLVSIPRDSYIPNPALGGGNDKLTHMGVYGIENSLDSLNSWLGTSIDKYAIVNFTTFRSIIDVIDGVDIDNPIGFTSYHYHWSYPAGPIHLDGEKALEFVRERYNLPHGDFDRNANQVRVMKAIMSKLMSASSLTKVTDILGAMSGTFLTNMPNDSIFGFVQNELGNMGNWNIISTHITGGTGGAVCASAPGQILSVVFPNEDEVDVVRQNLQAIYNGEVIAE